QRIGADKALGAVAPTIQDTQVITGVVGIIVPDYVAHIVAVGPHARRERTACVVGCLVDDRTPAAAGVPLTIIAVIGRQAGGWIGRAGPTVGPGDAHPAGVVCRQRRFVGI